MLNTLSMEQEIRQIVLPIVMQHFSKYRGKEANNRAIYECADKLVETLKNLKGRAAATLAPKIAKMMEFFEAIGNKLSSIKGLAGTGFIKKIFSKYED